MSGPYTVERREYALWMRVASAAIRFAEMFGVPAGYMEHERMLGAARRRTKLDDWGDESFIEPFAVLCDDLSSRELPALSRFLLKEMAVTACVNRLMSLDFQKRHAHVLDHPIERPVFILGFPRTGTTVLQNLMALDAKRRALPFWETTSPLPLVEDDPVRDVAKRKGRMGLGLRMSYWLAPEQRVMHEVKVDTYEECWPLFSPSYRVLNYDLALGWDRYGDWLLRTQDMRVPYAEYKRSLQVLCQRKPDQGLLLKCPEHLWFLDALFETFPDACVVWTHRDPFKSVASYSSMVSLSRRTFHGHFVPEDVGAHITKRFADGVERAMAARERLGEHRFYDASFEAVCEDPAQVVRDIRKHFDLPHVAGADEAMHTYLTAGHRSDAKGKHRYSAERYGLDADAVRERFSRYIDRFDIPCV